MGTAALTGKFEGKTMVVTGASRGIGAATALRLSSDGAHVVLADLLPQDAERVCAQIQSGGGRSSVVEVDVSDPAAVAAMGDEIGARHDALHGLVNAAGTGIRPKPVSEMEPSDWDRDYQVNLRGSALCVKALTPLLGAAGGSIVNIGSMDGSEARPNRAGYDATKAALESLTRSLAVELAPLGVRVNTIVPGAIVTERHLLDKRTGEPLVGEAAEARRQELLEERLDWIILERCARPEEVAACISFLLSDDASYVNATALRVDGGLRGH